jgi:hypothetical protein
MINQKAPRESDEQRIRREREETRADNQVTENLQDLLTGQTRRYRQRFGVMRNQSPSGPMIGQLISQVMAAQAGAAAGKTGFSGGGSFGGGGFISGLGRGSGNDLFSDYRSATLMAEA